MFVKSVGSFKVHDECLLTMSMVLSSICGLLIKVTKGVVMVSPLLLSNTPGFATLVPLAGRGLYMTGGWRGGVDVVKHKK